MQIEWWQEMGVADLLDDAWEQCFEHGTGALLKTTATVSRVINYGDGKPKGSMTLTVSAEELDAQFGNRYYLEQGRVIIS